MALHNNMAVIGRFFFAYLSALYQSHCCAEQQFFFGHARGGIEEDIMPDPHHYLIIIQYIFRENLLCYFPPLLYHLWQFGLGLPIFDFLFFVKKIWGVIFHQPTESRPLKVRPFLKRKLA